MPTADVVVVGAGLAGLLAAHELARRGAAVIVLAKGLAASHWIAGSLDVAAPRGATSAREGIAALAQKPGHPYQTLAEHLEPALADLLALLAAAGLPYAGDLDAPIRPAPTGIGATRPVSIVPAAQAAALPPWKSGETLVLCGVEGFKDFWSDAVAASLARPRVWSRSGADGLAAAGAGSAPDRVVGVVARLPGLDERRNLSALHIARAWDDAAWRADAIDATARAVDAAAARAPTRVGLPAVLGLREHAAVLDALTRRLGRPVFELPLVPPSVPGLRLHDALRRALRAAGGRIQLGESISRFEAPSGRVEVLATPAAVREFRVRAGAVILATGGLAGGGLVGLPNGRLREVVLDLPVDGPPREAWFSADPFDPRGHEIDGAGIRVDGEGRPIDPANPAARPVYPNVRVAGALLAGQRWILERCGDGVAIASARRAAVGLAVGSFDRQPPMSATADETSAGVHARAAVAGLRP